jgi:predicted DCC family thiol-disulfide oxidoreductase YuxK
VADGRVFSESAAILEILRRLGGIWSVASAARIVPPALRDPLYRLIARHRYQWFGRLDTCRLPTAAERERFL